MLRNRRKQGFALMMVMILLAAGVILGMAYVSSASMSNLCAANHSDMVQARYLAESGLQHAMYLMRAHPEMLRGACTTLGPYSLDGTTNTYTIVAQPTGTPNQYAIVSNGNAGHSIQTSRMLAQASPMKADGNLSQGILIGGGTSWVPAGMVVTGPAHSNGHLFNMGRINGRTTASGWVINWGQISPTPQMGVEQIEMPQFNPDDYTHYVHNGQIGHALVDPAKEMIVTNDVLCGGRVITANNPAGVAIVTPKTLQRLKIGADSEYVGTLIVLGDLDLNGKRLTLKAQAEYPALIVTGRLLVRDYSQLKVEGVVVAKKGIWPEGDGKYSNIQIDGAVVCDSTAFVSNLPSTGRVTYSPERAALADPSGLGSPGDPVLVQRWDE